MKKEMNEETRNERRKKEMKERRITCSGKTNLIMVIRSDGIFSPLRMSVMVFLRASILAFMSPFSRSSFNLSSVGGSESEANWIVV